jgi:predicted ester cyclase
MGWKLPDSTFEIRNCTALSTAIDSRLVDLPTHFAQLFALAPDNPKWVKFSEIKLTHCMQNGFANPSC